VICLFLLLPAAAAAQEEGRSRLVETRGQLLIENAALRARLSLSQESASYLVADLPRGRLELELQGVNLTSVPIEKVILNRHARRVLRGPDRVKLLEVPFTLQDQRWFEVAKTLALKDTSAVRSRPDTTGALMQAIRTTPVTAMLNYDRRLTVVLQGKPPRTRWERLRERVQEWFRSWSAATVEGVLRRQSTDEVMITLTMAPSDVRSLAPTLIQGTRLILIP
jgi:hypothetical protein